MIVRSMEEFIRIFGPPRSEVLTRGGAPAVLDRPSVDDGTGSGTDDWYTIKGRPWVCDCGASKPYMAEDEHPHRVIVWPDADDPNLLRLLQRMWDEDKERAEAVAYEKSMGTCVSFYELTPS